MGPDTTKLIQAIREGDMAIDSWLPILAGSASEDLFYPVRLLDRGADDVIYEPWLYLESARGWRRCCAAQPREAAVGRCCVPERCASTSQHDERGSATQRSN